MTQKPLFTPQDETTIFQTARSEVLSAVFGGTLGGKAFNQRLGNLASLPVLGTFVSFKKNGELRSCMGWMSEGVPLAEALRQSARTAALEDPRFAPIRPEEFEQLSMEVWVLWGMEEIPESGEARLASFEIGRHGLQIKLGNRRGLLLPGVAIEWNFSPLQFLEAVCRKAGLPADAWRDKKTTLYRFEGLAVNQEFFDTQAQQEAAALRPVQKREEPSGYSWNIPFFGSRGNAQQTARTIRPAAVAGMFYPKQPDQQKKMLDAMFETAEPVQPVSSQAVMIPHAGWVYSGRLAAQTLLRTKIPESVMIFSPKHRPEGGLCAAAPYSGWECAGRTLEADAELAQGLCRAVPAFRFDEAAHRQEHAVEVQLPLLARLRPDVRVTGAVINSNRPEEVIEWGKQFGTFLQTLNKPPLLIISSDMNHFADETETRRLDHLALEALETLNPEHLAEVVFGNRISMCGIFPALFVLSALRHIGRLHTCEQVGYTTSAEASGDEDRVVGYAGYIFR